MNRAAFKDAFKDAFKGLESWARFSYRKQLHEAMQAIREELDKRVYLYVSRFPTHKHSTLARELHVSPAKLSQILRPFPHGRKRGRRVKPKTPPTNEIGVSPTVVAVSHHLEREEVELALKLLDLCVVERKASDAGEHSYQNLAHWLKGRRQGSKALRDRAVYLIRRYEKLRHNL
jgi:hypothetical protein